MLLIHHSPELLSKVRAGCGHLYIGYLWSFESDYVDAGYNYLQSIVLGH